MQEPFPPRRGVLAGTNPAPSFTTIPTAYLYLVLNLPTAEIIILTNLIERIYVRNQGPVSLSELSDSPHRDRETLRSMELRGLIVTQSDQRETRVWLDLSGEAWQRAFTRTSP